MNSGDVAVRISVNGAQQAVNETRRVSGGFRTLAADVAHVTTAFAAITYGVQQIASGFSVLSRSVDQFSAVESRLRLVTASATELAGTQKALFALAQQNRVSYADLSDTFARFATAMQGMGVSQARLLNVTDAISKAVAISGGSAESARAALIQLGQGMSAGVLRGEELNSVLEQTPRLARAIAEGMGVPVGKLRELGAAGQITADTIVRALEKIGPTLDVEFSRINATVSSSFTVLGDATANWLYEFDKGAGITQTTATAMRDLADAMNDASVSARDFGAATKPVFEVAMWVGAAVAIGSVASRLKQVKIGLSGIASVLRAHPVLAGGTVLGWAATTDMSNYAAAMKKSAPRRADVARNRASQTAREAVREAERQMIEEAAAAEDARRKQQDTATEFVFASTAKQRKALAELSLDYQKAATAAIGNDNLMRQVVASYVEQRDRIMKGSAKVGPGGTASGSPLDAIHAAAARAVIDHQVATQGLNQSQAEFLRLAASPEWAAMTGRQRQQAAAAYEQIIAQRAATEAFEDAGKQRAAAIARIEQAQQQAAEAAQKEAQAIAEQVVSLREQTEEMGLSRDALHALHQSRLDAAIAAAEQMDAEALLRGASAAEIAAIWDKIDGLKALKAARDAAHQRGGEVEAANASRQAAKAAEDDWQRTADGIERSLTDALMRGFESGKGFGRNLADTLKNMFATLVLRPTVQAMVSPVGGGSSGGSWAGNLVSSLATTSMTGFSAIANVGIGGWLKAGASLIGTGTAAGIGAGIGMLAGPISIGLSALQLLGGGRIFGRGPRQVTGSGIEGVLSTSGADLRQFESWSQRGSLFRRGRSGTDTSPISAELDATLDASLRAVTQSVRAHAEVLGLNASAIDGVTQNIRISTAGLNEQQQREAIEQALGGFGDELAARLTDGAFARAGESASATLNRLANSLIVVNRASDTLYGTLMQASLASGHLASQIVEAFGDADAFAKAIDAYHQAIYTDAERMATQQRQIGDALRDLGFAMPDTIASFRALVDAQDLTTESGRAAFAALVNLGPAFAQVTNAATEAAEKILRAQMNGLAKTFAAYHDAQRRSIEGQIDQAQVSIDALDEQLRGVNRLLDAARGLSEFAQRLRAEFAGAFDEASRLDVLRADVAHALAAARGGDLDAFARVQSGAQAFLAAAREQADTPQHFARLAASVILDVEDVARSVEGAQQSAAQSLQSQRDALAAQQQTLRQQLAALTDTALSAEQALAQAREQFAQDARLMAQQLIATDNIAKGLAMLPPEVASALSAVLLPALQSMTNGLASTLAVKHTGVAQSAAAQAASGGISVTAARDQVAMQAIREAAGTSLASQTQAIDRLMDDAGYSIDQITRLANTALGADVSANIADLNNAKKINDIYQSILNRHADDDGLQYWMDMHRSGRLDIASIEWNIRHSQEALSRLPRFARGTNYLPADTLAMVHEGERIVPAADNRALIALTARGARDAAQMRGLGAKVQALGDALRAIAHHTERTARVLARVAPDGDALLMRTAAP